MQDIKHVLLDVDTGIDDSVAILYALKSPEIRVVGICTGFGNTDVVQATDNTLRLIQLANPSYEVPVAVGASGPLTRHWEEGPVIEVHGNNGIGDAELTASGQRPLDESAADFIVRQANERPGELILVTLGRLTNLAVALEKDPSICGKFKSVVMMGGTVSAPGNVTPVSEANFYGDPEAAALVFDSNLDLTVVGLDVTSKTLLTAQHLDLLARYAPPENRTMVNYLETSLSYYMSFYQRVNRLIGACPVHDPLALLVAIDPSLVKMQTMNAAIECNGTYTTGMVVTDRRAIPKLNRDIRFCVEVDAGRAINKLLSVFL
jgi:inosine-uridine nucleoside N-ribohydrolase